LISNVNQNEMPSAISVDLNSTPYSFVYKKISNHFDDSFLKKGRGFGSTYGLGKIPMRIDFMFTTPSISVNNFVKHNINLSDHKPISVFFKI
jgi:vancomycin resistance protein VanJ